MPWDFWLIFLFLAVVLPWRGYARLKAMLVMRSIGARGRVTLYLSTIAFQWLLVAVTAWRASARGLTAEELGLVVHGPWKILSGAIVGAATFGALQWLNLRRVGRSTGKARGFMQVLAERILPHSKIELLPYFALALTAGLCEEFLYRGFAMAALTRAGLPSVVVVLLSSVLFGLAHLYQGVGGVLSTLVVGTVFGTARIAYDGMVPVILWHAVIDGVAGVAGPKYLLKPVPPEIRAEIHSSTGL